MESPQNQFLQTILTLRRCFICHAYHFWLYIIVTRLYESQYLNIRINTKVTTDLRSVFLSGFGSYKSNPAKTIVQTFVSLH